MAPPKRDSSDAQGMRAISSFFAPKTNIVSAKAPLIGKASPGKQDRAAKAAKTDASDAPGSARKTRDASPSARSPDAPATASAKKSSGFRDPRRRSTSGAEERDAKDPPLSPPTLGESPGTAEIAPGAGVSANPEDDVGRRVAVWWPAEKKFYPARVSAVDAKRGRTTCATTTATTSGWRFPRDGASGTRADAVAAERFAAPGEEDDDIVSERPEEDSDADDVSDDADDDADDASGGGGSKKRSRTTARGAAAAKAPGLLRAAARRAPPPSARAAPSC